MIHAIVNALGMAGTMAWESSGRLSWASGFRL